MTLIPIARFLRFGLAALLGLSLAQPLAWAWGRKSASDAVVPPPPVDAEASQCEPIRGKIQTLYDQPKAFRFAARPRIGLLKQQHQNCLRRVAQQKYLYLKQWDPNGEASSKAAPTP